MKFLLPVPSQWKSVNSPAQFQMAPEDGKAMIVLGLEDAQNLDAAKSKVINDNKLQVIESSNVKVNGLNAIALLSDIIPVDETGKATGTPLKVLTYLIEYDKGFTNCTDLAPKKILILIFYFSEYDERI